MTSLNLRDAVKRAVAETLDQGGATIAVKRGQPDPTSGYVVADGRHEQSVDLEDLADLWSHIDAYATARAADLAAPGVYLGTWLDGDGSRLVLDVVEVIPERETARTLGRERGEQAIFGLHTGEVIWL
jgi:hypothetical protein